MKDEAYREIAQHGADNIENLDAGLSASDLHHHLYNEDYFIIGTYQAKEFLANKVDGGVFNAIEKVREYEQNNFGEVNTDFSDPEKVVNMYAYIVGEEILAESETLQGVWSRDNDELTSKDLANIHADLEKAAK